MSATIPSQINPPRGRPCLSAPDPEFTSVLVGEDKTRFVVHKSLLTHYSGFFRKALSGSFIEATSKTVKLEEDPPIIMQFFVHWLYHERFPAGDKGDDAELVRRFFHTDGFPDDDAIIKLYIFGDKYEIPELQKAALDLLYHTLVDTDAGLPSLRLTVYAFDHLLGTDPLCRLLVDMMCAYEKLEDEDRKVCVHPALMQAIWHRYVQLRYMYEVRHKRHDVPLLCEYHNHETEQERKACEEERARRK